MLSGASCHDSAKSGFALPVPSFQSSREKTWSYMSALTAPKFHGLKLLKSPASAKLKVPPFLPLLVDPAAAAGLVGAAPAAAGALVAAGAEDAAAGALVAAGAAAAGL